MVDRLMKNYEPRSCVICGAEYLPKRSDQRCCLRPECREGLKLLGYKEYREKNYGKVLERNRTLMRKKREEERRKEVEARDTIIGEGYAERQIEQTLKMVGRVNTKL